MGMYTELVLKCNIRDDVPQDVRNVLKHLFNQDEEPVTLPDHQFFKCQRWQMIGQCSSFYHHPKALSDYWTGHGGNEDSGGCIFSRSDLKNYGYEITHFIDWLMPYIDEEEGQCIGWEWYEEDTQPTLLFKTHKEKA
jgi:hypothetical protein